MIKIALCDDEKYFLDKLEKMLKDYSKRNNIDFVIRKFNSSIQLMESLKLDFQIYFLDIQMPNMNGIELAKILRKHDADTYMVFITSYRQYMPIGYEVNAANYLEKPVDQKSVDRELDRAIKRLKSYQQLYLTVKNLDGFYKVYLHNLRFIETRDRKSLLHTEAGDIISYKKLLELEQELAEHSFFRCHNSYIVNIAYVEKIVGLDIYLTTGEKIYTSKAKKKELLQRLAEEMGCVGNVIL
ncbi:LytR/AlgR family response regulator transcription factor [Anaerocolumna xylanovorans]|uniref:Stage 0 sporulation protein A homolog n=1 Tax=Anaerocolumna xylanovorans DSM 12503 TaxID=1121345 RepID=A0A1M7Y977_9FIRM|nr:LytTR family DNA-binding domain-containing protein [Anaerocolumna xylanovorans]SHO49116.1 two component transcriptional regulator, LytTR family [Anaerocolumna xylanovorans DSM 12503]